jgi:CMP-N,N'-diacetyllegionaminic acid synthase
MNILAIIPARSGSKTIKDKNIRQINGKPMIFYSIYHAQNSKYINRIIVSTDSIKYSNIARKYGAEVPFIRPAEYAQDNSTDFEVFQHTLKWLEKNENYCCDLCVHLRPTHPIRKVTDIDKMINYMINNPEIDSMRSIVEAKETPYKMWFIENDLLRPVINTEIQEAYNKPRQQLPQVYYQNASIDIIRTSTIIKKKSISGENIAGYLMEEFWDIDNIEELKKVRKQLKGKLI